MTLTGRLSEKFWEVETDLKWESLTRTSNQGKPLRVVEADVEGDLALGGGDHVRVGQAHFKLQVVLCIVAKTIPEKVLFLEKLFTLLTWDADPMPNWQDFQSAFLEAATFGTFEGWDFEGVGKYLRTPVAGKAVERVTRVLVRRHAWEFGSLTSGG